MAGKILWVVRYLTYVGAVSLGIFFLFAFRQFEPSPLIATIEYVAVLTILSAAAISFASDPIMSGGTNPVKTERSTRGSSGLPRETNQSPAHPASGNPEKNNRGGPDKNPPKLDLWLTIVGMMLCSIVASMGATGGGVLLALVGISGVGFFSAILVNELEELRR